MILDIDLAIIEREQLVARDALKLIGEQRFPQKLKRWERFHNRVLRWDTDQAQYWLVLGG